MARFKRCSICGVSVKLENLERHVAKAHPGQKVDFRLSDEEERALKAEARRRPSFRSGERLLYPLVAVAIVAAVIIGVVLTLPPPQNNQSGTPAADFVLPTTEGGSIHLADLRGGVVLLDFMDTDCHFCQQETRDVLVPLHAAYRDRVTFVSVNVGFIGDEDTVSEIVSFKALYGATWTYAIDDGNVAPKYSVAATPTTYVLNPDLTIQASFVGATTYETLSAALDEAL